MIVVDDESRPFSRKKKKRGRRTRKHFLNKAESNNKCNMSKRFLSLSLSLFLCGWYYYYYIRNLRYINLHSMRYISQVQCVQWTKYDRRNILLSSRVCPISRIKNPTLTILIIIISLLCFLFSSGGRDACYFFVGFFLIF